MVLVTLALIRIERRVEKGDIEFRVELYFKN